MGERIVFPTSCVETKGYPHPKVWTWIPISNYIQKLNKINQRSKISAVTVKLLKENIGVKNWNLGLGNVFLAVTSKAHRTKEKIYKLNLIKIKK